MVLSYIIKYTFSHLQPLIQPAWGHLSCRSATITCQINNDCEINCGGEDSCNSAAITLSNTDTGILKCTGSHSCRGAVITLPNIDEASLNCTNEYTCQSARITCPNNYNCTIHCGGLQSCNNAQVTCPTAWRPQLQHPLHWPAVLWKLEYYKHTQCLPTMLQRFGLCRNYCHPILNRVSVH